MHSTPPVHRSVSSFDVLLVGGGLQNALMLLAFRAFQPELRVALFEASSQIGGNHTWCFHELDLPEAAHRLVEPLLERSWPAYDVLFPGLTRTVDRPYTAITSERLNEHVRAVFKAAPQCALFLDTQVENVGPHEVRTSDGRVFHGALVCDARGPSTSEASPAMAYQKFLGLEFELETPAATSRPRLMDARVPQLDGFRFVYVLPFTPHRVLVEDTYYSDSSVLDRTLLRERVRRYAQENGYVVRRVLREEHGVLPLPLAECLPRSAAPPLHAGYAGGWFHPTTGYSLPLAARLALFTSQQHPHQLFSAELQRLISTLRRQQRFCLTLNRLLFGAFAPEDRRGVLERFHTLPAETISRFYALRMTRWDRLRILCGRPPRGVSFKRAISGRTSYA